MSTHGQAQIPLVGRQHEEAALLLLEQVRRPRGSGFSMTILEGASGAGKSRIIRHAYSQLVAEQPSPGYWPPIREDFSSIEATRKTLGPGRAPFDWQAGSLPTFLWWDLTCRLSHDAQPSDAVTEFAPFLLRHAVAVSAARASELGFTAQAIRDLRAAWLDLVRDTGGVAAIHVLEELISQITSWVLPGIGAVVGWLRAGLSWMRERQASLRAIGESVSLDAGAPSLLARQADILQAWSTGPLPTMMCIEDLHWMGPDVSDLLRRLMESDTPVTVFATAWPEGRTRRVYRDWLAMAGLDPRVRFLPVEPPDFRAGAELVSRIAPNTTVQAAELIARYWPNPLALLTMLMLGRTKQLILENNGLLNPDEDLWDMPRGLEALYTARFDEVPRETARVLAATAGSLPQHDEPTTPVFVENVIAERLGPASHAIDHLQSARDDLAWLNAKGAGLAHFREAALQRAAVSKWAEDHTKRERREHRLAVVDALRRLIDERRDGRLAVALDDEAAVAACNWLLDLMDAT